MIGEFAYPPYIPTNEILSSVKYLALNTGCRDCGANKRHRAQPTLGKRGIKQTKEETM